MFNVLTIWMNGVWVEEGVLVATASVDASFGVFTPDPIELFVEAYDNLVKQPVLKVIIVSTIYSWADRQAVLQTQCPGEGRHNCRGIVLFAR